MSMVMAILYLILSISLHACSARRLGFLDKQETVPHKKLVEPMLPAQRLMNLKENLRAEADTRRIRKTPSTDNSYIGATTVLQEEDKIDNKGNEAMPPIDEGLMQKTAEIQGRKRQARLIIESAAPDIADETMVSNEKDMGEDIAVMDYAQPHRKPPIHNKEP